MKVEGAINQTVLMYGPTGVNALLLVATVLNYVKEPVKAIIAVKV